MLLFRMMWKDWGFAPSLYAQAKVFLDLAKQSEPTVQEGHIRAAIVFSLMSFEAYWRELIKGFIQSKGASIDPASVSKVTKELDGGTGLKRALEEWPVHLVGTALDTSSKCYSDFSNFREYRNFLVHGKISEPIRSSWGKLAQEVETLEYAELALYTVSEMVKMVASHFGYDVPVWA